jgi:hypothetical protein
LTERQSAKAAGQTGNDGQNLFCRGILRLVRSNSHGIFYVIRAKKMEPIIGIDEEGASLTKSLNVYSEARSDAEDKVKATAKQSENCD